MRLSKMTLSLGGIGERDRRLDILRRISRDAARLFFPFLHDCRIAHHVDLFLVIGKAHPAAEARFVKVAQLRLIMVMISRTQQRAAEPAAGDVREISLE